MRLPLKRWLDNVAVGFAALLMVLAFVALIWFWAGATMTPGPARDYQCSVGNQRPFVCEEVFP